ncbi:MAG: Maf family nucleotide pyrophosphatase [Bacteroidales bacterium]|nr:Maf family nucleotide pyrophosphatase [Bacteroidales bacterium]MDZ4203621.1 Maf family nucleotide pyrophosphatase [Bacteroidales bacterium]
MLINQLNKFHFILGSKSPRRQYLLRELGLKFGVLTRNVDETYPLTLQREEIPLFLCKHKAEAYSDLLSDERTIIITADTIVWIDGMNLGKPANEEEAAAMLHRLSGRKHEVLSGVCLRSWQKQVSFHACSEVFFKQLRNDDINYYVSRYRPFDKAGAYGIQEWIGYIGIEKIKGSFYNVMGLPTQKLYDELLRFCGLI